MKEEILDIALLLSNTATRSKLQTKLERYRERFQYTVVRKKEIHKRFNVKASQETNTGFPRSVKQMSLVFRFLENASMTPFNI